MRQTGILAVAAACAMVACTGLPAAGDFLASRAYADGPRAIKYKGTRAVRVRGMPQRGGYYSYVYRDVINSYPWARLIRFSTPFTDQQSPGGPFDSGFFFDSGIGPRWNNTPYPR